MLGVAGLTAGSPRPRRRGAAKGRRAAGRQQPGQLQLGAPSARRPLRAQQQPGAPRHRRPPQELRRRRGVPQEALLLLQQRQGPPRPGPLPARQPGPGTRPGPRQGPGSRQRQRPGQRPGQRPAGEVRERNAMCHPGFSLLPKGQTVIMAGLKEPAIMGSVKGMFFFFLMFGSAHRSEA